MATQWLNGIFTELEVWLLFWVFPGPGLLSGCYFSVWGFMKSSWKGKELGPGHWWGGKQAPLLWGCHLLSSKPCDFSYADARGPVKRVRARLCGPGAVYCQEVWR